MIRGSSVIGRTFRVCRPEAGPSELERIRDCPLVRLRNPGGGDLAVWLGGHRDEFAGAEEIARALREAWSRGAVYADRSVPADVRESHDATGAGVAEDAGNVIAVLSGKGAPGVTTIAIGLAAALGERRRRSVLVDADLRGGNVAAYLDLDPRRGLLALPYGAD